MKFAQPYFVTPHAVDRFRRRVAKIRPGCVPMEVQHALQYRLRVVEEGDWQDEYHVYACTYRDDAGVIPYYAVVGPGEEQESGPTWPAVMTIKGEGSIVHQKLSGNERLIEEKGRAVILPETGEIQI